MEHPLKIKNAAATGLILSVAASLGCVEQPRVHVSPTDAMVYEPVAIRVASVPKGETVTVHATMVDESGVAWESRNEFRPQHGVVDLSEHAPVSGSYQGVSPMGFIWSMTPSGADTGPPRMFESSSLEPLTIDLAVHVGGDEIVERRLTRRTIRPGVRRVDVIENGLVGAVFLPDGAADVPGILVLGGSDGGMWEQSAAFLASEGYAALALAYFGVDGLPETLASIPLEYFETAIAHLQDLPEVDADQVGVIGVSRGGELALLLGATYPQIKGVIAYVPSGLVWFGLTGAGPAWTLGGAPVPYVTAPPDPELQRQFQEAMMAGGPASWAPVARSMMEKELQGGSEAVIEVERINGPILMFSGTDDGVWPSGPLAEVAIHRLEQHDFRFPYDHVSYREAGHVFPPPYLPARYAQAPNGFLLGGSPEGTAHAQEDCWKRTLEFLGKALKNNHLDRP